MEAPPAPGPPVLPTNHTQRKNKHSQSIYGTHSKTSYIPGMDRTYRYQASIRYLVPTNRHVERSEPGNRNRTEEKARAHRRCHINIGILVIVYDCYSELGRRQQQTRNTPTPPPQKRHLSSFSLDKAVDPKLQRGVTFAARENAAVPGALRRPHFPSRTTASLHRKLVKTHTHTYKIPRTIEDKKKE